MTGTFLDVTLISARRCSNDRCTRRSDARSRCWLARRARRCRKPAPLTVLHSATLCCNIAAATKPLCREALAALLRAYHIDPSCDPTLLHSIAQTAFVVRDWQLVDSATALLLTQNADDANALVWRAAALQHRNDFQHGGASAASGGAGRAGQSCGASQTGAMHQGAGAFRRSRDASASGAGTRRQITRTRCSICRSSKFGLPFRGRLGALRIAHDLRRSIEWRATRAGCDQRVLAGRIAGWQNARGVWRARSRRLPVGGAFSAFARKAGAAGGRPGDFRL